MRGKKSVYKVEARGITIKTTDGKTMSGKVNLGTKKRVSDLFIKTGDPFIVLFEVDRGGGSEDILFVNKNHVVWAQPEG